MALLIRKDLSCLHALNYSSKVFGSLEASNEKNSSKGSLVFESSICVFSVVEGLPVSWKTVFLE